MIHNSLQHSSFKGCELWIQVGSHISFLWFGALGELHEKLSKEQRRNRTLAGCTKEL